MGFGFYIAAWYYTLVALFSGYVITGALLLLLQRLAPSSGYLRQLRHYYVFTYPVSVGLYWALQLHHALQWHNYVDTLYTEIPRTFFSFALFALSVLSLLCLIKKVRQQHWLAIACSALVAGVFVVHQLYPFVVVDVLVLRDIFTPLAISAAWFAGLLFLLLLIDYLRHPNKRKALH